MAFNAASSADGRTHTRGHGSNKGRASTTVHHASEDGTGRRVGAIFFQDDATPKVREEGAFCLRHKAGGSGACVMPPAMQVRRLTPRECERLQGFPDDYTAIPWRKKPAAECPDSLRYKALGNSWAVPVVRWIGARINQRLAVPLARCTAA